MYVKFTCVFVLDKHFEILILWIQEEIVQSQPLQSAVPISLNPAVTWSDHYTTKNAWLVSSTLQSLAQQISCRPSRIYNWRIIVIEYKCYSDCCNGTTMLYRLLFFQGKAYWLVFKIHFIRVEQFGNYI
jgi:hypothetical protein